MVAGSVSDLTLKEVVDALLGGVAKSSIDDVLSSVSIKGTHTFNIPAAVADDLKQLRLDKVSAAFQSGGKVTIPATSAQLLLTSGKPGEVWHLTDLTTMRHYQLKKSGQNIAVSLEAQFYFAPAPTSIGTIVFPAGFYLNGALDLFGYHAEATVNITANRGVSVDAKMDKIELGKGVFALTSADGNSGPSVSISTMLQPDDPIVERRLPHFYIDGAAKLLGLEAKVFARASIKGLLIDLKGRLAPGVEFDLDVQAGGQGLAVDGDISVGIGKIDLGKLGKVKVDTEIEGSLGVRVNGQEIAAFVEADFEFLGQEMKIGKFALETKPDALARLAETMTKKAEALLRNEFANADRWANAVKNGAIDGVEDAAKVLQDVYGKSEKEAKAVAKDVEGGVKSATKTVAKETKKFGKKLKKLF
jgi:hypothetical protein